MRQNPRKITGGGTLRSDLEESRTCCDGWHRNYPEGPSCVFHAWINWTYAVCHLRLWGLDVLRRGKAGPWVLARYPASLAKDRASRRRAIRRHEVRWCYRGFCWLVSARFPSIADSYDWLTIDLRVLDMLFCNTSYTCEEAYTHVYEMGGGGWRWGRGEAFTLHTCIITRCFTVFCRVWWEAKLNTQIILNNVSL
jgi:hypothetical protein